MSLIELLAHQEAEILELKLTSSVLVRVKELGLTKGSIIKCLKVTPFKGPRVYQVGNSVFSIDRSLASAIKIKRKSA